MSKSCASGLFPSVPGRCSRGRRTGAFTLLELLAVVAVLGIAGALLVPAMGQTGVLRVQAAVRTVISDITFAQSDAVAFQENRALVFNVERSSYSLVSIPGDTIDTDNNTMYDPTRQGGRYIVDFTDDAYGGARITSANFDGESSLIFDSLGGPIATPDGDEPGSGGTIVIAGSGSVFTIVVEAFTGRVSVTRADADPSPGGGG